MEDRIDQAKIVGSTKITLLDNFGWAVFAPEYYLKWIPVYLIIFVTLEFYLRGFTLDAVLIAVRYTVYCTAFLFFLTPIFRIISLARLPDVNKEISWECSELSFDVVDKSGVRITLPWSQVKMISERRPGFLVSMKPKGHRWILRRAFDSQSFEELRALFERLGLLK